MINETDHWQAFEIDDSIVSFAKAIVADIVGDKETFKPRETPDFKMPANQALICTADGQYMVKEENGRFLFFVFVDKPVFFGAIQPSGEYLCASWLPDDCTDVAASEIFITATILSILSQPRVIIKERADHCRKRREFNRGGAFTVDAWTRVSWDLSKATKAKIAADPTFRKVPYHFRRGHPRRAEEHYKGAYQMPCALRDADKEGWWQWIAPQFVGHPAFGFRRSVHAPKLSTGQLAKAWSQPWANHGRDQHGQRRALPETPAPQGREPARGGSAHCLGKAPLERKEHDRHHETG